MIMKVVLVQVVVVVPNIAEMPTGGRGSLAVELAVPGGGGVQPGHHAHGAPHRQAAGSQQTQGEQLQATLNSNSQTPTLAWTKNPNLGVLWSLIVANAVFMPRECFPKNVWPGAAHIKFTTPKVLIFDTKTHSYELIFHPHIEENLTQIFC